MAKMILNVYYGWLFTYSHALLYWCKTLGRHPFFSSRHVYKLRPDPLGFDPLGLAKFGGGLEGFGDFFVAVA